MVQQRAFAEHLKILRACRLCPNVFGEPVVGAVADARVMLVGQAPGPHEVEDRRPFAYTAGKRMFGWFARFGVDEEQFRERVHMCAVIRCFPGRDPKNGGDRVPHPAEIANCAAHLDREIALLAPKLIIAVGTLAARELTGSGELRAVVGRMHRAERAGKRFEVIVLPHPSGRSTWINKAENRVLLDRSLELIGGHRAWRLSFRAAKTARKPPRKREGDPALRSG